MQCNCCLIAVEQQVDLLAQRSKMPRFRMLPRTSRIVALCSAANFINAADRVIMPIAIVLMTDEFKWNLYWQGWILSAFAFGYFTSQVKQ